MGARTASSPRTTVAASWRRVAACGLEPGSAPEIAPLHQAELQRRRAESELGEFVPRLTETLSSVIDAGQMVVVADAEGRVLWRAGTSGVRRMADGLGFVGGSAWTEGNVGTNAIGTSLVLGEGVHIQGPEHFVESHTRWGCAAAPLRDPWSGRTLGVVDVSGPSRGMHPAELALVELASRLTSMELVDGVAPSSTGCGPAPLPCSPGSAGTRSPWTATVTSRPPSARGCPSGSPCPTGSSAGPCGCHTWGGATPSRWPAAGCCGSTATSTTPPPSSCSTSPARPACGSPVRAARGRASCRRATRRSSRPSSRPVRTDGRPPALAQDLFDDRGRVVTVRAEMSRLRRAVGGVLHSGPYRIAPGVSCEVRPPRRPGLDTARLERARRPAPAARHR